MPEGEYTTREVDIDRAPQDVHRELRTQIVPRLESCGYKLQDSRDESLSFRRRYLPRAYLTLGLLVLGVSILLINTGPQEPQTGYVIAGWVAIGFMAIYRRHETLSPDPPMR